MSLGNFPCLCMGIPNWCAGNVIMSLGNFPGLYMGIPNWCAGNVIMSLGKFLGLCILCLAEKKSDSCSCVVNVRGCLQT